MNTPAATFGPKTTTAAETSLASGDQLERVAVCRTDDQEISSVDARHCGDSKALGDRDYAGVDQAEIKVKVLLRESGAARPVRFGEVGQVEISCGDRDNEGSFGLCPKARGDQPRGLDSHRRGQDKLHALASFEHRGSLRMPVIVGVGRSQQNAGVDDDGTGWADSSAERRSAATSRRNSLTRPDRSPRPEWPIPMNANRGFTGSCASIASTATCSGFTPRCSRDGLDPAGQLFGQVHH